MVGCAERATGPDTGTLALTVTSQSSLLAIDSWRVTVNGPSGAQTQTGNPGGTLTFSNLLPGSYSVLLEGFEGPDLAQRGQGSVTVVAGSNTQANIAVSPVPPEVSVTSGDPNAGEAGPDPGTFTITRTGTISAALAVNVTLGGTATAGTDYSAIASVLTLGVNQRSVTVSVLPILDAQVESPETVALTIGASASYTIGAPSSATVTIADAPVVTVAATDPNASEVGPDPGAFTITRSGATTASLSVSVALSGTATLGTDYQNVLLPVFIPAGQASVQVAVNPVVDAVTEGAETVVLTLTANPALYAVGTPNQATVTIADAAPPSVTVTAIDGEASEVGPATGTFRIVRSLTTAASLQVTVTLAGNASNGVDYQSIANVQTIPAGASFVDVTVTPIADALVEGLETVVLTVVNGTGYVVGAPASAGVTIADAPPPVSLSVNRTLVSFAAFPNSALPVAQTVDITASGGASVAISGTILYTVGTPGWINNATLNSATTPATLTIPVNTTGLAAGTYGATVRITATGGASVDVIVLFTTNPGVGFGVEQFALIPAGSYLRGSGAGGVDELPIRMITLTQPFRMQLSELTQGQWRSVTGSNPSGATACGDTCPVEGVSWDDIQVFLQLLNQQDPGKNYRLATEAQWEYAARAGSTTEYGGNNVLDDMGWWSGNSSNRTQRIIQKRSNAWGLYDMHGNVWEWVNDFYQTNYYSVSPAVDPPGPATGSVGRVLRGGAFNRPAVEVRSAYRGRGDPPSLRSFSFGLRLVRDP